MRIITNAQVAELISVEESISAMRTAFQSANAGSQQSRVRTTAGGVTLSCMGAVMPDVGITGAKVYTTINGRFHFVIVLFSTKDGRPLATIESDTMTGLRTAAATAVATDYLARKEATTLSVIGTGVQARSHVPTLMQVRAFEEILVAGIDGQDQFAEELRRSTGVSVKVVSIEDAVRNADVLVTVTRATTPLLSGDLLRKGVFVAAVGASKATVRELDDSAVARASALVVEWKAQAQQEAGDLVMCKAGTFAWDNVMELGQIVDGSAAYVREPDDIVIYKAIGVGLEDIALAGLAYRKACIAYGW